MLKIRKKLAEKKEASKGIAKAGFTLIELLVVLAILAILVLLAAPRFLGYTKDANVSAMQADAKVLANAALVYNIDNDDSWPVTETVPVLVDGEGNETELTEEDGSYVFSIDTETVLVNSLDEDALRKDHVQSLKGEFSEYALVAAESTIDGNKLQKGDIVFIGNNGKGVKDKDDNTHYAVNIEIEDPATP